MTLKNAAIMQEHHPGSVIDYLSIAEDTAAETNIDDLGYAIVTFPRSPKPHEVVDTKEWVKRHWSKPLTYV